MGGNKKKSTKKFEKNHLKDTIDKRKEFAKTKQRHQTKLKKRARAAADNTRVVDGDATAETANAESEKAKSAKDLSHMSVDEFFQGVEIPDQKLKKGAKTGKRKRELNDEEEDSDSSPNESFGLSGSEEEIEGEKSGVVDSHKDDLDALSKNDPEFYKYLEENDAELLDFDENKEINGLEDLDDELLETETKMRGIAGDEGDGQAGDGTELTMPIIEKWKTAMEQQHSLRAMRETVLAFKAAAHINSEETKLHKYTIPNADIYHSILLASLQGIPKVLHHHLPPKDSSSGKVRIATDSKKFRSICPTIKSYAISIHHLLETLSDAPTIKLTLNAIEPLLPYILSFGKLLRHFTKTVVTIWSSTSNDSASLLTAFLVIRRLFVLADSSLGTAILKVTYLNLVKASRNTNAHTLPTINLLKNSAAELWSLDPGVGYATAFSHIRQLAVHLRGTITHPTKESHKQIYNWQYIHSLDFWARVLCQSCSAPTIKKPQDSPLHPLIYPVVQLTLGTLRLIPSPTYFPLHLHLIRTLLRISFTTKTYIPLAPSLLSILSSAEMTKPPSKASTLTPLPFTTSLRAPKPYLRTRTYQDGIAGQVQLLLAEFFTCWGKNIAFPELIVPPIVMLKRWLKSLTKPPSSAETNGNGRGKNSRTKKPNKNPKIHALFSALLQKLNQQADFVERRRANVTFSPRDREEVDAFLRDVPIEDTPLGNWVEGVRVREREGEDVGDDDRRDAGDIAEELDEDQDTDEDNK